MRRKVAQFFNHFNKRYEVILYTKGNYFGVILIPVIEINFEKYYSHILHDMENQYMYRYLVSK